MDSPNCWYNKTCLSRGTGITETTSNSSSKNTFSWDSLAEKSSKIITVSIGGGYGLGAEAMVGPIEGSLGVFGIEEVTIDGNGVSHIYINSAEIGVPVTKKLDLEASIEKVVKAEYLQ